MLWNQPQIHHTTTGTPFVAHGSSSFGGQTAIGNPAGFLVGSEPMLAPNGQPALMNLLPFPNHTQPSMIPMVEPQVAREPSVYEDTICFEHDLNSIEAIFSRINDGSVVVRYEAIVALGAGVEKYLDAFVIVANELSWSGTPNGGTGVSDDGISNNLSLSTDVRERLTAIWIGIRSMQKNDPFPAIANAANRIVNVVHERLFCRKTESEETSTKLHSTLTTLTEVSEEDASLRTATDSPSTSFDRQPIGRKGASKKSDLRRVASETIHSQSKVSSMEANAGLTESHRVESGNADTSLTYTVPKSEFYNWKKGSFIVMEERYDELDPLSPMGIARQYQERRNVTIRENGERLANRYSCLAPKPAKPVKQSIEMILEDDDDDEGALLMVEEEIAFKKKELEYGEKFLFRNDGVKINSLLSFHPVETYLMACGDTGAATLWDTETGKRCKMFNNENLKASRMTSSCWINPYSSSHFMIGCDDGNVRIWCDVLESTDKVSLLSSFNAVPMTAGQWGSGLITDWQSYSGSLVAGGNSKLIRCWDLESEKVINTLETNSDAYVTTLTTAWDEDTGGIGKDIIAAGMSDGALKLFDIRKNPAGSRSNLQ